MWTLRECVGGPYRAPTPYATIPGRIITFVDEHGDHTIVDGEDEEAEVAVAPAHDIGIQSGLLNVEYRTM